MRLSLEELANEAEVDTDYVRRLIEVGALEHKEEPSIVEGVPGCRFA